MPAWERSYLTMLGILYVIFVTAHIAHCAGR